MHFKEIKLANQLEVEEYEESSDGLAGQLNPEEIIPL